jgi:NAD(P)-dependent dehydrogenase (short-subunit alcohol dehydrogenase family)
VAKKSRLLTGKVVAITGGARGIGRATAATLAARGARVAIGDLDAAMAERVAAELGSVVVGLPLDVTSRDSFTTFLDEVERRLGPLDEFASERDAVTERVLDVNLGGTALGCKLALERLLPRDTGHIVNLASALGRTAVPGGASYCASKYAVVGLTEALRAELVATNVELHLVLPGFVDTEMSSGLKGLRGTHRSSPARVGAAIADALQSGRGTVWVPAVLGPMVAMEPITPRSLVAWIGGLLGTGRLLTQPDALERAAYEARIAPPADRAAIDPALTVANAAASVADAVRAGDRGDG